MISATLVGIGFVIWLFMTTLFIVSLIIHRNDIADVAWGIGILLACVTGFVVTGTKGPVVSLLLALVFVWSIRLAVRIGLRNFKKETEDYRYRAWREAWGRWVYVRSYAQIYLLQGLLMIVVAYPVIHSALFGLGAELTIWSYVGALVWLIGFVFEVVSDYQLDQFIKQPDAKGKIMTSGLWQFSRHPNYFGEITMWWGIWCIIAPLPYAAAALIGPITITYLIVRVSGIPMLEAKFAGREDWEAYCKTTSVLIPWPQQRTLTLFGRRFF